MAVTPNPPLPELPSLLELKKSIPAKYFQSNLALSMAYVIRSALFVSSLMAALWFYQFRIFPMVATTYGSAVAYATTAAVLTTYWYLQGVLFWGIFTLGHDCGHGSFSSNRGVNWLMGLLLHTFISVPYDPWRMSHRHHHKNTGNLDTDEIFYPMRKNEDCYRTRWMCWTMGGAWWCYLFVGFPPRQVSHVSPFESLWGAERYTVHVSLAFLAVFYAALAWIGSQIGFLMLGVYYFVPVYVFGCFLVITTFLHHNAEDTEWYAGKNWDYVRGNLMSIDRDYGWINSLIHNIGTHQIHHLFPIIPHYHLNEATAHFRKAFPHLARDRRDKHIIPEFISSLWMYTKYGGSCPDDAEIFSYKSAIAKAKKAN